MGCSQGKATKPCAVGACTSAEPMPTILSPSSPQKQTTEAQQLKVGEGVVAPANDSERHLEEEVLASANDSERQKSEVQDTEDSAAVVQAVLKDWPLRWKALRMFAMAEKGPDGQLDVKALSGDGSDKSFSEMLQAVLHGDVARLRSQGEWLESVKQFVLRDEAQASVFLDLCEMHIIEQKEQWALRDEALQVFAMGDRNGDAQLDMSELTEIRQSDEFARAMMHTVDIDKNGRASKGEWLAYIKRLADDNEQAASAVLSMYKSHLSNSSNTAKAYAAAKDAMDVLVDDSVASTSHSWWACC